MDNLALSLVVIRRSLFFFLAASLMSGCQVVSANRAFPTVTWYWSKAGKQERADRASEKAYEQSLHKQTP